MLDEEGPKPDALNGPDGLQVVEHQVDRDVADHVRRGGGRPLHRCRRAAQGADVPREEVRVKLAPGPTAVRAEAHPQPSATAKDSRQAVGLQAGRGVRLLRGRVRRDSRRGRCSEERGL